MTDPQTPPAKPSRRRVVIWIAIAVGVAAFTLLGVGFLAWALYPSDKFGDPATGAEWVLYTSAEHGYSVEFPAEPKEQTQAAPFGDGTIDVDAALWEDLDSGLISSAAEFPAGTITDIKAALRGSMEGAIGNIPGAMLTDTEAVELAGMSATRAEATSPDGDIFSIIAFDDEGTVQFALVAVGVDEATAQAFFDSFVLTD